MSDWQTILAIDFDKHAVATYAANFPDVRVVLGSVADEVSQFPYADIIVGGPPCQPFSDAGENQGEEDSRDCIPDFIAAVGKVRPRMFLMENVSGLLKARHLLYFGRVLGNMESLGYRIEYRVLDAVDFGVPQFRNRVWVWWIRADVYAAGARHEWPEKTHQWPPEVEGMFGRIGRLPGVTVGQALGIWYPGCGWGCAIHRRRGHTVERRNHPASEPSPTLDAGADRNMHVYTTDHGVAIPDEPSPTLKAGGNVDASGHQGGGCPPVIRVIGGGSNPKFSGDDRSECDITEEPCTTLAVDAGNSMPQVHEYRWSPAMLEKHPPASPASPASPAPTVQAKYAKGGAEGLVEIANNAKHQPHQPHQPANTLGAGGSGHGMSAANMHVEIDEKLCADGRTWEQLHPPATPATPAPTVRARSPRDGGRCTENVVRDGVAVRRLTPLECLRLQSGPDTFKWPEKITKTAMYRIVGNGQASLMTWHLSRAMKKSDPQSKTIISLFCGGGVGDVGFHGRFWEYKNGSATQ